MLCAVCAVWSHHDDDDGDSDGGDNNGGGAADVSAPFHVSREFAVHDSAPTPPLFIIGCN